MRGYGHPQPRGPRAPVILQRPSGIGPRAGLVQISTSPSAAYQYPSDEDEGLDDVGAIETADTRPDVSLEDILELEATLSAISTLQLQAFVNTYRIYPGGEAETATPVTSTASLLTDTGATRGSYGDTAYFESHPQLCKHYRKVHSEAIITKRR